MKPAPFRYAAPRSVTEALALRLLKDDWDTCRSIGATQRAERNAIEGWGS